MSTSTTKTKDMVTTAMFVAIILAMSFVPYLGYIPLGFMNATIIHIPVIIGAILLGPARGAFLGGIFGLTSMINNTFNPNLTSFVFFSRFTSLGNVHGNFKSLMILLCAANSDWRCGILCIYRDCKACKEEEKRRKRQCCCTWRQPVRQEHLRIHCSL